MLCVGLLFTAACLGLVVLVWFLLCADADLTVLLAEKLGKPVDSLAGKVVWVVGASSGIGEHLAYKLAAVGAKLVLTATDARKLENVKEQCHTLGLLKQDVLLLPFNVANFACHRKKVEEVLEAFGTVDILVNNAGRSQRADFANIGLEVDREMFDVNVFGAVSLTRLVLKHFMTRGGGHVVVTSSIAGKAGIPNAASYTGSKHALHGYFECLRHEYGSRGIDVTVTCPGPVFSNLLEKAYTDKPGAMLGGRYDPEDKRMSPGRCAQIVAVAIANRLDEVWISPQPDLMILYGAQYVPSIFRSCLMKLFIKIGAIRSVTKKT